MKSTTYSPVKNLPDFISENEAKHFPSVSICPLSDDSDTNIVIKSDPERVYVLFLAVAFIDPYVFLPN